MGDYLKIRKTCANRNDVKNNSFKQEKPPATNKLRSLNIKLQMLDFFIGDPEFSVLRSLVLVCSSNDIRHQLRSLVLSSVVQEFGAELPLFLRSLWRQPQPCVHRKRRPRSSSPGSSETWRHEIFGHRFDELDDFRC